MDTVIVKDVHITRMEGNITVCIATGERAPCNSSRRADSPHVFVVDPATLMCRVCGEGKTEPIHRRRSA
jgi:hypothetical protein